MSPFRPPIDPDRPAARGRFTLQFKSVILVLAVVLAATGVHIYVKNQKISRAKSALFRERDAEVVPALQNINAIQRSIADLAGRLPADPVMTNAAAPGLLPILKGAPVIYTRLAADQWAGRSKNIWSDVPEDAVLRCVGIDTYMVSDLKQRTGVVSDAWWNKVRDSKSPFFLGLMNKEWEAAAKKERADLQTLASAKYFVLMRVLGGDHRVDRVEMVGFEIATQRPAFHVVSKANAEAIQAKNDFYKSGRVKASGAGEQNVLADCSIGLQLQNFLNGVDATPQAQATP